MNFRLHPDDLKQSPYKELVESLTSRWNQADLPGHALTDQHCTSVIQTLLLTTQSMERTSLIVEAVLAQACELRKPPVWVEQELKFEGMLEGADRADFLRFELEQATTMDDAVLDQYNERVRRFSLPDQ